ncbi:NAD(P)/FAD-dependent oxidoreductase [Paenibacillus validus]|uniref:FAD-dependent oxidoreductase n=1 Tax=Paenibacillus validus TaxID=44253 RepID=A0A7X2Z7D5_9BACL|nr:FAD-binding oxidoreductase [Paenibacillus validus]MUG69704.1 FAD-dependent oxidoreductase [Paenibacillus validus]
MNLISGRLLWPLTWLDAPTYPKLGHDIECDCLIVGGGEAGASCAYELTKLGVDTVLVDKQRIGAGSTSANTGLVHFANDKSLTSCIHTFGERAGLQFYKLCRQAVNDLEKTSGELDTFPDFMRRESLYFASCEEDLHKLKQEYETLSRYGFPVAYLEAANIRARFPFEKPGAILSNGDAEINPYKNAHALIQTARRHGLRVYEETQVQRHEAGKDYNIFITTDGRRIQAKKTVFTTGYETQEIKPNPNAVMSSTYAIATKPVEALAYWPTRCIIWETARPYLFMRTTADNRVIIGGLDETTTDPDERDRKLPAKQKELLQEAIKLFPALSGSDAEYAWAGLFGGTHDGLPLIGRQAGFPHCYFALVYGGNGTLYSTIAARIIGGLITEGSHPDAPLFRFDRPKRDPGFSVG